MVAALRCGLTCPALWRIRGRAAGAVYVAPLAFAQSAACNNRTLDLLCGLGAFRLERHASQTEIKTLGSALFWTTTQLLTVSSSFKNPVSFGGRVLDVFMEAYAIIVIAALAGAFGAFIQKRGLELDAKG
jgi:hypothetical protein